jgi:hypothetical protein
MVVIEEVVCYISEYKERYHALQSLTESKSSILEVLGYGLWLFY